jgi:hypothetical protein
VAILVVICVVVLIGAVLYFVGGPLRVAEDARIAAAAGGEPAPLVEAGEQARELRLQELEAAREAKYREIRDAELDYRTGKLSAEDYETVDAELRAEALRILDELEGLKTRGA